MWWLYFWAMLSIISGLAYLKLDNGYCLFLSGLTFGFLLKDITYLVEIKIGEEE